MARDLAQRLIDDLLWDVVEPLMPVPPIRPQGGGRARTDDRAVFTAITFVLISESPWRALPKVFGVKPATAHRRFLEWTSLDIWSRIHTATLQRFGPGNESAWTAALAAKASQRTMEHQPVLREVGAG